MVVRSYQAALAAHEFSRGVQATVNPDIALAASAAIDSCTADAARWFDPNRGLKATAKLIQSLRDVCCRMRATAKLIRPIRDRISIIQ